MRMLAPRSYDSVSLGFFGSEGAWNTYVDGADEVGIAH